MAVSPRFARIGTALTLVFCAVVGGWRAWSWSRRPPEPSAETEGAEARVTSRMEGVEASGEDADGTAWQLHAAEGWGQEGEVTGTLSDVRVILRKAGHDLLLHSPRAEVDQGNAFHLAGSVRITWDDYEVQAEGASYLRNRGLVTSAGPVVFTGPGLDLSGIGVEVTVDTRVVRIPEDARAVIGEEWQ